MNNLLIIEMKSVVVIDFIEGGTRSWLLAAPLPPMETTSPIDVVSLISAFPESKVLADAEIPLVAIAANRPCVLHLFTG